MNGQRADSAAKAVRPGDVLTIALPGRVRVLRVTDVAERRGPASEAQMLYDELTDGFRTRARADFRSRSA